MVYKPGKFLTHSWDFLTSTHFQRLHLLENLFFHSPKKVTSGQVTIWKIFNFKTFLTDREQASSLPCSNWDTNFPGTWPRASWAARRGRGQTTGKRPQQEEPAVGLMSPSSWRANTVILTCAYLLVF